MGDPGLPAPARPRCAPRTQVCALACTRAALGPALHPAARCDPEDPRSVTPKCTCATPVCVPRPKCARSDAPARPRGPQGLDPECTCANPICTPLWPSVSAPEAGARASVPLRAKESGSGSKWGVRCPLTDNNAPRPRAHHSTRRNNSKKPGKTRSSLAIAQRRPNSTMPGMVNAKAMARAVRARTPSKARRRRD